MMKTEARVSKRQAQEGRGHLGGEGASSLAGSGAGEGLGREVAA